MDVSACSRSLTAEAEEGRVRLHLGPGTLSRAVHFPRRHTVNPMFTYALLVAGTLSLAACGSGGSDSTARPAPDNIRILTGLSAPTETVADQLARSPAILARADSLVSSTIHGETDHADIPTFRLRAQCSATRCQLSEPRSGYSFTTYLSDFEIVHGPTEAIGSNYGITIMSQATESAGTEFTSLGAWMDHSAFAVQTEQTTVEGIRVSVRYGLAGGDLTGAALTGGATWLGIMVGTPSTASNRGARLTGTAALNYDFASSGLDVAFSGIKNIDRGRAHTTEIVMFNDIIIDRDGTFEAGLTGNRIQGGFYGPDHAEVTGIFEQSNIVGAFGAKKQ